VTQQEPPFYAPGLADAGAQLAQLRQVLALVEEMAGRLTLSPRDDALDEAARVSAAYARALPIDQKRFDALAGETARWARAGVEALLKLDDAGMPVRAAAERLAEELEKGLAELGLRLPG
jgi:benzoyl-CoA reductase/2-hydroxyglutaryl-CoA dehydratase subunit BcrC/BadD/HgdB